MDGEQQPILLIVEDSETNVDILVETLGDEYDVMVAMDGEEALELLEDELPDLILLDIMMPGMDGFEVFSVLKEKEKTNGIPVIFLSAETEGEVRDKALAMGAADYLTKPFDMGKVLDAIRKHLAAG